jgi:hypothetical protein
MLSTLSHWLDKGKAWLHQEWCALAGVVPPAAISSPHFPEPKFEPSPPPTPSAPPSSPAMVLSSPFVLSQEKSPLGFQIRPLQPMLSEQPCVVEIDLFHPDTKQPVTLNELAVVHTKPFHLFVVDDTLQDYHHIHPEPTERAGVYRATFVPHSQHSYRFWGDCTLKQNNEHCILTAELTGKEPLAPPPLSPNTLSERGRIIAQWHQEQPLRDGKAGVVTVTLCDSVTKQPIANLEPLMGAFAHLVGFSDDGKTLIHSHPLGHEPQSANTLGGSPLKFHLMPECEGNVQFYLQIQQKGDVLTLPFVQPVLAPEKHTTRVQTRPSTPVSALSAS